MPPGASRRRRGARPRGAGAIALRPRLRSRALSCRARACLGARPRRLRRSRRPAVPRSGPSRGRLLVLRSQATGRAARRSAQARCKRGGPVLRGARRAAARTPTAGPAATWSRTGRRRGHDRASLGTAIQMATAAAAAVERHEPREPAARRVRRGAAIGSGRVERDDAADEAWQRAQSADVQLRRFERVAPVSAAVDPGGQRLGVQARVGRADARGASSVRSSSRSTDDRARGGRSPASPSARTIRRRFLARRLRGAFGAEQVAEIQRPRVLRRPTRSTGDLGVGSVRRSCLSSASTSALIARRVRASCRDDGGFVLAEHRPVSASVSSCA